MFCEKLCSVIIWFWYQIIAFSFYCEKFNIYMFYYIFHSSFKNCFSHQLKKYFQSHFVLRSALVSIYGFSQAFWLILIETNPWFNVCFKFIMCITYSDFSCKLQAFLLFKCSFFLVKALNLYDVHVHQLNILNTNFLQISTIIFFFIDFYEIFTKLRSIF